MCNQTGKAGDTVDVVLSQSGMIDVCGDKSDKDIIILISVGRVQQTDSLFGFNFEIKYDSVKFKFHSPVYLNTLAEFFEIKDVNFGKKGLVRGYASVGLLGRQISGNRPLIGIYGDYIDNCPGSSEISLNYIEFTDEFQKVIRSYVPTTVYATEVYKPTRFLHTDFLLDSIVDLRKDSIINVRVNFVTGSQLKLDTGEFEIYFDNSNLIYLKNIKLSNDLELISESSEDHSKYQIEVKFNNLKDQYMDLRLIVKENKTDSCKIKIVPISTNYCSCVKKLDGDSIMIKSKEIIDTSTVVWEKESDRSTLMNYYDYVSESFVIDLNDYMDGVIKVYDICGSMIIEKNFGWSKKISIDGKYLNKGIYLAIINNDLKINKIILIKN